VADRKAAQPSASASHTVTFGRFRLDPGRRLLEADGVPVPIGGRAIDILIALASRPNEVISHNDLIDQVWPDTIADGGNLRFHITALRNVLGEGRGAPQYIVNIHARGYCFVPSADTAPLVPGATPSTPRPDDARGRGVLPPESPRMVRRADLVAEVSARIAASRFVTLVGPGGIGKTTAAVATAHALKGQFNDVRFIDLAGLQTDLQASHALAAVFGLVSQADDPTAAVVSFLRDRRVLLVLDSCEPVIEGAAAVAEAIHLSAPSVVILATSREPLRVEGEQVLRLAALAAPPADADLDWPMAQAYAAVELFADRALASGAALQLDAAEARIIADICCRLDGLPLAIEIAAGQVVSHGLMGVSDLLAQNFNLLLPGRRTATPRHQTLDATLGWSYDLLRPEEQAVLRRLSMFVGLFDLAMARRVASAEDLGDSAAVEAVAGLVGKSLITVDGSAPVTSYRLPDATRIYGLGKLQGAGETAAAARRHASMLCDLLVEARESTSSLPDGRGYAGLVDQVGNVRAALQWSFGPDGDPATGVRLAAAAYPLFVVASLASECRRWTETALAHLDDTSRGGRDELELQFSLIQALLLTVGNPARVGQAIDRGLEIAERLDDAHEQLRFLSADHIYRSRICEFDGALATAKRIAKVAHVVGEPPALAIAESLLSISYHRAGDLEAAQRYCESALAHFPLDRRINLSRFGYDHRVRTAMASARTLWLRGYPDRAAAVGRRTLSQVQQLRHPGTTTFALTWIVPVFLWNGDWDSASDLIAQLLQLTDHHPVVNYNEVGQCLRGEFLVRTGDPHTGVAIIEAGLEGIGDRTQATGQVCALADGLRRIGDLERAERVIGAAINEIEANGHRVFMSDMLRIRAEILAAKGEDDAAAEAFRIAMAVAGRQGARGLELRAALSWAERLAPTSGDQARALVAPLAAAFTEGFETADLRAAARFL
jgi:predicted ATPase/DNA-binding winged helix-turn-helix (wHTH) protein